MKKIVFFVAVAVLVLFSQAAFAADQNTGIYIGISGGYVIPSTMKFTDKDWTNSEAFNATLKNGVLGGVKAGWNTPFTNKIIAVELEYNYIYNTFDKDKIIVFTNGSYMTLDGTIKINAGFVNLKARYPEGRFHPYVGGGAGYAYMVMGDVTNQRMYVSPGGSGGGFAYQVLAGLDFDITPNFGVGIGYKYFATTPTIGSAKPVGSTVDNIYAECDYKASIVTLGLAYTF